MHAVWKGLFVRLFHKVVVSLRSCVALSAHQLIVQRWAKDCGTSAQEIQLKTDISNSMHLYSHSMYVASVDQQYFERDTSLSDSGASYPWDVSAAQLNYLQKDRQDIIRQIKITLKDIFYVKPLNENDCYVRLGTSMKGFELPDAA